MRIKYLIFFLICGVSTHAQQAFTLKEAVEYGVKNHLSVKNAELDIIGAELTIKQIKASGMPQLNGQFSYTYNAIIPTQLLDAKNFDPNAPDGAVTKFKFGVPWAGQAGLGLNQLIFDATWLVGLKAAPVYRELARKGVTNSKIVLAENIAKAYYSVLVAEERGQILDLNIARIDSLIKEMSAMFKQGFIEKIDLDRLEVQRNNLLTESQKVKNLVVLSQTLLKFQMGLKLDTAIALTDKLSDTNTTALALTEYQSVDFSNRIEYSTLMVQRQLAKLDIERTQKGILPKFSFNGSFGAGHSNTRFNPFERWFGSSALTLGINIPIYDSGLRRIQVQQQQIALTKLDQNALLLRESFDLQAQSASINLKNGLESLNIQQRNLELAQEVIRVTKIKYQAGTGSNIEVVNAESALKEAQTNYFAALYDVLIAKVDLDKAMGKLWVE